MSKLSSLMIIILLSVIFLLSLYESVDLPWGRNDIHNCGGIDRKPASQVLSEIYVNDSDFQNLTKGNYAGVDADGNIFNEIGESRGCVRINYVHEVTT